MLLPLFFLLLLDISPLAHSSFMVNQSANNSTNTSSISCSTSQTLNFSYPLYLHPPDIHGINLVSQLLTERDNYGTWRKTMMIAMLAKNKFGSIDGSCIWPYSKPSLFAQWERCNAIVFIMYNELCFKRIIWRYCTLNKCSFGITGGARGRGGGWLWSHLTSAPPEVTTGAPQAKIYWAS